MGDQLKKGLFNLHSDLRRVFLTFDLFFDRFGGIQPVPDVIHVSVLQAKVILFDQVQRVEDLLI